MNLKRNTRFFAGAMATCFLVSCNQWNENEKVEYVASPQPQLEVLSSSKVGMEFSKFLKNENVFLHLNKNINFYAGTKFDNLEKIKTTVRCGNAIQRREFSRKDKIKIYQILPLTIFTSISEHDLNSCELEAEFEYEKFSNVKRDYSVKLDQAIYQNPGVSPQSKKKVNAQSSAELLENFDPNLVIPKSDLGFIHNKALDVLFICNGSAKFFSAKGKEQAWVFNAEIMKWYADELQKNNFACKSVQFLKEEFYSSSNIVHFVSRPSLEMKWEVLEDFDNVPNAFIFHAMKKFKLEFKNTSQVPIKLEFNPKKAFFQVFNNPKDESPRWTTKIAYSAAGRAQTGVLGKFLERGQSFVLELMIDYSNIQQKLGNPPYRFPAVIDLSKALVYQVDFDRTFLRVEYFRKKSNLSEGKVPTELHIEASKHPGVRIQ